MMKKILHILCLCLVSFIAKAQDQSQHQLFMGNAAVDYRPDSNNLHIQMQLGSPYITNCLTCKNTTSTFVPNKLQINSPSQINGEYSHSVSLTAANKITADLELAVMDGCWFTNAADLNGKIAVVNLASYSCYTLEILIYAAKNAGAVGVIFVNTGAGHYQQSIAEEGILVVMISLEDGTKIIDALAKGSVNATYENSKWIDVPNPVIENKTMIGFPYGVRYIAPTFNINGFEVSKGYFTDRVHIKWEFSANQNLIEKINIYRKELGSVLPKELIGSVAKDVFEYNDTQVEGGVLYTYEVEVVGVSAGNELYINYIEGVGFRNPTATVSGSISYEGGSPVKDVIVFAEANGADNKTGTSLNATNGYVDINKIRYDIPANKLTIQTWMSGYGDVFKLTTNNDSQVVLKAGKSSDSKIAFILSVDTKEIQTVIVSNAYPTGELDEYGNDEFKNISSLTDTSFIHISAVLEGEKLAKFYINGRELTTDYIDNATTPEGLLQPSLITSTEENYPSFTAINLSKVVVADNYTGFIDEVRVWQRILSNQEIRRDYRRYLGGGENGLSIYLRMDENADINVYDLSKKGFRQNKNDGYFVKTTANSEVFSTKIPTSKQLGVFGVTDENGGYLISSISYAGTGESFAITPSFGVHKFRPAKQTLFLGTEASVENNLNFTDISSFRFDGRAIYNVQNVFDPETDEDVATYSDIKEVGYNQYSVNDHNGNPKIINKGEYYYEGENAKINPDPTKDNYIDGELKRYVIVGLEGANIYIDDTIVLTDDNLPAITDADGNFSIKVPIGEHRIEVRKANHTFVHNGYFPKSGTHTFVEDQLTPTIFIDSTRISLIGRIVGGKKEFEKPLGFGANGKYKYKNFEGEAKEEIEIVSSSNNIGVATFVLKAKNDKGKIEIKTNPETGEYEKEVIPYIYEIDKDLIKSTSNEDITLRTETVNDLNISTVPELDSIKHTTIDGKELYSKKYHYTKSFKYNSDVTLKLLKQEFEEKIKIGEVEYDISSLAVPLYTQNKDYHMVFEISQNYINKDNINEEIETKEYYNEGKFVINNNLAVNASPIDREITTDKSPSGVEQFLYKFKAGVPNSSQTAGFKKEITLNYKLADGTSIAIDNIDDFKSHGIVNGKEEPTGQTYVTIAPQVPDIILRDPPGSNSSASIEKGTKISFTRSNSSSEEGSVGRGVYVSLVPEFKATAGTPFFSVGTELEPVVDAETNFSKSQQINQDGSTTETYEFKKTISTSSDPNYVGAEADVYIGNAKNEYYGITNAMFITTDEPTLNNNSIVPSIQIEAIDGNGDKKEVYLSFQETYFVAEQPTNTFFIYSQKALLEQVIPDLEDRANAAPNDVAVTSTDLSENRILTKNFYLKQIKLWRKIIQDNERDKYLALNKRAELKTALLAINKLRKQARDEQIEKVEDLPYILQKEYSYPEFDVNEAELNELFLGNFESNISIDAGVGAFTSSVTTSVIASKSYSKTIDVSNDFIGRLGLLVNNQGGYVSLTGTSSLIKTTNFSTDSDLTTTISYTLADNDKDNYFAVDVVNLFNGFGPVFITKGGASSCPYEGASVSKFYKNLGYDEDVVGVGKEVLSVATTKVYKPELTVRALTKLSNIPETKGAVFILVLKNTSATKSILDHRLYIDNASLNGAVSNIDQNGITISLPYNEEVEVPLIISKNPLLDVINYEDIKVFLANPCNDFKSDEDVFVALDVAFKRSCSNVTISTPEDNFLFNIEEAALTTNILPISFTDFNIDFNSFIKIKLEYRSANEPDWTPLRTYYKNQDLYTDSGDSADIAEVISPSAFELTYNWYIDKEFISDGDYEVRAVSYCTNDITNSSNIINGKISLNAPVLFGTPQPSDGILDIGEDISVRFNENVFESGKTRVSIEGLSNQQAIDHDVSVFLDGSNNQIILPNQTLPKGSFTMQFWFKNATTASGNFITQENGINASLNGNELSFSIAGESVKANIDDSRFNFYSLVYQAGANPKLLIFENGQELSTEVLTKNVDINSKGAIAIGGANVKGNIHDVRLWSKIFTPAQATVAKDLTLSGRETNLMGYWILNEGNGKIAIDRAKSRNATLNLSWGIAKNGTSFYFENNSSAAFTNVGYVQPSIDEDITLSFWVKTPVAKEGTIFSNGRGNDQESIQTNKFRNKWSVNMKFDGTLELMSENISYSLTTQNIADNSWHHVAIVVKRAGSLNTYVDALETSSISSIKVGGIVGNKILVGARLFEDTLNNETIDNHFNGFIDELRLWNTARSFEQIKRDRYFEINTRANGLMLYVKFNEEIDGVNNAPTYYHLDKNNTNSSSRSIYVGTLNHSVDSPPLKPLLKTDTFNPPIVINGDQVIIDPDLSEVEWSRYENQILHFTISGMYDEHGNQQKSAINWSAYVSKQEIEWYTVNNTKEIMKEKNVNEAYSFIMDIVNKGGSNQPYTINGLPTWISVTDVSGSVTPNSTKQVEFTVDKELAMGTYNANIFLETATSLNDRLILDLRVLTPAPDWSVNAADYSNSMNIVSKIKINNTFSRDVYTKVGAFVGNTARGEAYLKYDASYDAYFAYLTVYNNDASNEEVTFKIWDALNGKILIAAIDDKPNTTYIQNEVLGTKSNPRVFAGANFSEQTAALNKGWTWVSFYVEDDRFTDVKDVFEGLTLEKGDQIKTSIYVKDENDADKDGDVDDLIAAVVYANFDEIQGTEGWFGSVKNIKNTEMYKVSLANANQLRLIGNDVDETNVNIQIEKGWNWLSFPIHRNVSLPEALSLYTPSDEDVIKDQYNFAIYDQASSSWSGSLNYMQSNRGYMMKSGASQILNYPNSENTQQKGVQGQEHSSETIAQFSKYNSNMSVVAEVLATEKYAKVMVYDSNNTLRGESSIVTINNKEMSFISVFSDTNDVLTFKLSDGVNEVEVGTRFVFESNKVDGNIKTPVILSLKSLSTIDLFSSHTILYPNPFSNSIIIDSGKKDEKVEKIEIYSTIGALVNSVTTKKEVTTVSTSNLAKGIYLIKLTSNSGNTIIKKMVKN